MGFRAFAIKSITRSIWRSSPRFQARAAARFSQIETDSAHQFLFAAERATTPELKAQLLLNSLEEHRHGQLFQAFAKSRGVAVPPLKARRNQVSELGTMERFLAYAQASEASVYHDFEAYTVACSDKPLKRLFEEIREDEQHHGSQCESMLSWLVVRQDEQRRLLRWAHWKRLGESFQRVSSAIGSGMSRLVLCIVYFVLCGWVAWSARKRLASASLVTIDVLPAADTPSTQVLGRPRHDGVTPAVTARDTRATSLAR